MPDFFVQFLSDFSVEISVSFFTYIAALAVGFIIGKTHDTGQCRKLKKILGFKKTDLCEVIIPTWEGTLEYNHEDIAAYEEKKGIPPTAYDYVRNEEAEALLHIQNVCDLAEIKSKLVLRSHNAKDISPTNNKFLCGGPLANIYLKRIFSGEDTSPFSFKKRFLFGCKSTWMSRDINKPFLEIQKEMPLDTKGRVFFIQKDETENEFDEIHIREGFMFLIKKTTANGGTHFICFGNSSLTSMRAVKCLIDATDIIYDLTKKHKKHFFIIFRCSYNGDIDFEKDHIIDLTEKMFGTN